MSDKPKGVIKGTAAGKRLRENIKEIRLPGSHVLTVLPARIKPKYAELRILKSHIISLFL